MLFRTIKNRPEKSFSRHCLVDIDGRQTAVIQLLHCFNLAINKDGQVGKDTTNPGK